VQPGCDIMLLLVQLLMMTQSATQMTNDFHNDDSSEHDHMVWALQNAIPDS